MKELYLVAGISKQALHKYNRRKEYVLSVSAKVISHCNEIRKNHKRMGCRRMYWKVSSQVQVGRDLFEQIGFTNGFKLKLKRSVIKTTWASKLQVCPNYLEGRTLTGINQALQSDFFYLKVGQLDYYGIAIIDVYSRRLLALHVSNKLTAQELVKALREAVKNRKGLSFKDCIFHSDRGTQFLALHFKEELEKYQFKQSMCKLAQENAYVERVQGTIKNEYLGELILTPDNIQSQIKKIKNLYNYERPHTQLGKISPICYENRLLNLKGNEGPPLTVYEWTHPLLTKNVVTNKEKRSKKETTTLINN